MNDTFKDKIMKQYPMSCTLAFCKNITEVGSCPTNCKHLPKLLEFESWRKKTEAIQPDELWCPSVWVAQKPNPSTERK